MLHFEILEGQPLCFACPLLLFPPPHCLWISSLRPNLRVRGKNNPILSGEGLLLSPVITFGDTLKNCKSAASPSIMEYI